MKYKKDDDCEKRRKCRRRTQDRRHCLSQSAKHEGKIAAAAAAAVGKVCSLMRAFRTCASKRTAVSITEGGEEEEAASASFVDELLS